MRNFKMSVVHIAFSVSLIFHAVVLAMDINVDTSDAAPIEIFKIRYSPAVKEPEEPKKEIPAGKPKEMPKKKPVEMPKEIVTEIPVVKEPKKEIPVEKPKEMPEEKPVEMPKEIVTEIPEEITTDRPKHPKRQAVKVVPENIKGQFEDAAHKEVMIKEVSEQPKIEQRLTTDELTVHSSVSETAVVSASPPVDMVNISEIVASFTNQLESMKWYPRIARRRGIEGEVIVEVLFDKHGGLVSVYVKQSSGYKILDKAAVSLVKKASPFRHGTGKDFAIEVPITYTLVTR